jgi:hypothetical protein
MRRFIALRLIEVRLPALMRLMPSRGFASSGEMDAFVVQPIDKDGEEQHDRNK